MGRPIGKCEESIKGQLAEVWVKLKETMGTAVPREK